MGKFNSMQYVSRALETLSENGALLVTGKDKSNVTEWKQYGHVEFMNLYRAVRTVILAGIAQPQFLYRMTQVY
jgi:hypothetical protein